MIVFNDDFNPSSRINEIRRTFGKKWKKNFKFFGAFRRIFRYFIPSRSLEVPQISRSTCSVWLWDLWGSRSEDVLVRFNSATFLSHFRGCACTFRFCDVFVAFQRLYSSVLIPRLFCRWFANRLVRFIILGEKSPLYRDTTVGRTAKVKISLAINMYNRNNDIRLVE